MFSQVLLYILCVVYVLSVFLEICYINILSWIPFSLQRFSINPSFVNGAEVRKARFCDYTKIVLVWNHCSKNGLASRLRACTWCQWNLSFDGQTCSCCLMKFKLSSFLPSECYRQALIVSILNRIISPSQSIKWQPDKLYFVFISVSHRVIDAEKFACVCTFSLHTLCFCISPILHSDQIIAASLAFPFVSHPDAVS